MIIICIIDVWCGKLAKNRFARRIFALFNGGGGAVGHQDCEVRTACVITTLRCSYKAFRSISNGRHRRPRVSARSTIVFLLRLFIFLRRRFREPRPRRTRMWRADGKSFPNKPHEVMDETRTHGREENTRFPLATTVATSYETNFIIGRRLSTFLSSANGTGGKTVSSKRAPVRRTVDAIGLHGETRIRRLRLDASR